jgi:hypothetical protein
MNQHILENQKIEIENKLNEMNLTLLEYIEKQEDLNKIEVKEFSKLIISMEEELHNAFSAKKVKIKEINRNLILLNEKIENLLYIELIKKDKKIIQVIEKLKVIYMLSKRKELNKKYTARIEMQIRLQEKKLKDNLDKGYKGVFKQIIFNYIVVVATYGISIFYLIS